MLRHITLAALSAAFSLSLSAQVSTGGTPYGIRRAQDLKEVPTVRSAPFDPVATAADDVLRAAEHKIPAYARLLTVEAGLMDAGLWTELPNGDRLWRLRVVSDGALATELYFKELHLPENSSLYIYKEDGNEVLGGFSAYNNTASGTFATTLITGDASIMEYYEPQAARGEGRLQLASVGHVYRDVEGAMDLSGPCQVDVNCSEGDAWHEQRDAVVRIGIVDNGVAYWCSGSLVNNLAADCKPYFLTAMHCGNGTSAADFDLWRFYFNYERTSCNGGGGSAGHSMLGCTKRAESNDNGGMSGSDFLLLEANTPQIPADYTPYWSGWDASGTGSIGGVGIHHPQGDRKKISTYTGATVSSAWTTVPNTHWRMTWAATANGHGTTEPGSSGSPLFNSAHRVIGTLSGGASTCDNANSPDLYGKMSYHWSSNPGPVDERLNKWLDPNSTGILSMDGSYDPCNSGIGIREEGDRTFLPVFPNPASGPVHVGIPQDLAKDAVITVLDMSGRVVARIGAGGGAEVVLDVTQWDAGAYFITLVAPGTIVRAAPLIVVRP